MNLVIKKEIDEKININEANIVIKVNANNSSVEHLIRYISDYEDNNAFLLVSDNNYAIKIDYKDIVLFFSDKRNNYCKTMKKVYKTRKKLYEIESITKNFLRINKGCIVNLNYIEKFDMNEKGKIAVILKDGTQEVISRRRIKKIMRLLEEMEGDSCQS